MRRYVAGRDAAISHRRTENLRRDAQLGYNAAPGRYHGRCLTCGRKFGPGREKSHGHQPPVRLMRQFKQRGITPPYPPVIIDQCLPCNMKQGYQLLHDWDSDLPPMAELLAGAVPKMQEAAEAAAKVADKARRDAIRAARLAAETPEVRAQREARRAAQAASAAEYRAALDVRERREWEARDLWKRQRVEADRRLGRFAKLMLGISASLGFVALSAGVDPRWALGISIPVFVVGYVALALRHPNPDSILDEAIRQAQDEFRPVGAARRQAMKEWEAAEKRDREADEETVELAGRKGDGRELVRHWLETMPPGTREKLRGENILDVTAGLFRNGVAPEAAAALVNELYRDEDECAEHPDCGPVTRRGHTGHGHHSGVTGLWCWHFDEWFVGKPDDPPPPEGSDLAKRRAEQAALLDGDPFAHKTYPTGP